MLPVFASGVVLETVAVLTIEVGLVTAGAVNVRTIDTFASAASVPREAVTVPPAIPHVPTDVVQEMKFNPIGSVSVIVTLLAGAPEFVTVIVNKEDVVVVTGFGEALMLSTTSGSTTILPAAATVNGWAECTEIVTRMI